LPQYPVCFDLPKRRNEAASQRLASKRSHGNTRGIIVRSSWSPYRQRIKRGMHHLRRGIIGKISGFAAICAILLLSLAPVASQAFEHARIESLLASVCASDAQASRDSHPANHHVADHLQACAYCDLIAHAPTPPVSLDRAFSAFSPRDVFPSAPLTDAPRRELVNAAQPRAPPAFA